MNGARLQLPDNWTPADLWEDEQVAAYRLEPTAARAYIEHGATEPVMIEEDGSDLAISEPPSKVGGWLKTELYMLGARR